MPIRDTDEASCVAWLMRLYQPLLQMLVRFISQEMHSLSDI